MEGTIGKEVFAKIGHPKKGLFWGGSCTKALAESGGLGSWVTPGPGTTFNGGYSCEWTSIPFLVGRAATIINDYKCCRNLDSSGEGNGSEYLQIDDVTPDIPHHAVKVGIVHVPCKKCEQLQKK